MDWNISWFPMWFVCRVKGVTVNPDRNLQNTGPETQRDGQQNQEQTNPIRVSERE